MKKVIGYTIIVAIILGVLCFRCWNMSMKDILILIGATIGITGLVVLAAYLILDDDKKEEVK